MVWKWEGRVRPQGEPSGIGMHLRLQFKTLTLERIDTKLFYSNDLSDLNSEANPRIIPYKESSMYI